LVTGVANLANLMLSESEITYYEKQLKKVLAYVAELSSLDAGESSGAADALDVTPERQDLVTASLNPEEAMQQAPKKIGTAFQVPRIIE
jgi:aspartyl-tRNA(Asn)/glutamyl-tRNA(Gln) amidotransferase subunit C